MKGRAAPETVHSPGTSAEFAAAIDEQRAQIAGMARVLGYDAMY